MSVHPYLASSPDPVHRFHRAYFWLLADRDFRHADYWRGQVDQAREGLHRFLAADGVDPGYLSLRFAELDRSACLAGFSEASKRSPRSAVVIFHDAERRGGFSSCSASTTATNSHFWENP